MIDIVGSKDCGNSPKNRFVENIVVAIETGNVSFLTEVLSANAAWSRLDGSVVEGQAFLKHIKNGGSGIASVKIDYVLPHGKIGSATGIRESNTGKLSYFCHIIEFTSAKCTSILKLSSYGKVFVG